MPAQTFQQEVESFERQQATLQQQQQRAEQRQQGRSGHRGRQEQRVPEILANPPEPRFEGCARHVWLNLPEHPFCSPLLTDGLLEERNRLGPKCLDVWLGNQYGSMGGPPGAPQSAHSLAESAVTWEGLAEAGEEVGRDWARVGRLKEPDEVGGQ
jgi:hypothetical protein